MDENENTSIESTGKLSQISCSQEELETVRLKFLDDVKENPSLYNDIDIERCKTDEWTVKRFIAYKKHNLNEASAALIKSMRWRKEWNASSLKETDFPTEFYFTGETHVFGRDKNNISLVFLRVRYHKCLPDFYDITKKYLIYIMELMDEEIRKGSNGWALIYDCDGGTIFNNNMEILFFMVNTFFDNYPMALSYIGMYQLPWVLKAIYHICRSWIPEDYRRLFTFLDKNSIHEMIGTENLPDYLKGTSNLPIRTRTPNNLPMREWAVKNGVSESGVKKFFDFYQKFLDEGDRIEKEQTERREAERKKEQEDSVSIHTNSSNATLSSNNNHGIEVLASG